MQRVRSLLLSNFDIALIISVLSLTTFTMGLMQPVLPLYAESLGASVEQWGLIAAMWGIAMAVGEPVWGRVHDRIDRFLPLFFRLFSGSLVFLAFTLPTVFGPLYLLNFWRGFSDASSWPTSRSLVSRAVSSAHIGLAMGFLATGARLGGALGAYTGGQVANVYGYKPTFVLAALVSLSAGLLIIPRYGWPRLGSFSRARPSAAWSFSLSRDKARVAFKQSRPLLILLGVAALSGVGWFGSFTFLPFIVTSSLHGTVVHVGILFNISSMVTAALTIPMGGVGDRIGRRKMMIAGLVACTLSLLGVAFVHSFVQLVVLVALGAAGQAAVRPSMDALVADATTPATRGQTMGIYGMCEDMGGILGPALGSLTWRLGGPTATFAALSCVAGLGSVVALGGVRERRGAA